MTFGVISGDSLKSSFPTYPFFINLAVDIYLCTQTTHSPPSPDHTQAGEFTDTTTVELLGSLDKANASKKKDIPAVPQTMHAIAGVWKALVEMCYFALSFVITLNICNLRIICCSWKYF